MRSAWLDAWMDWSVFDDMPRYSYDFLSRPAVPPGGEKDSNVTPCGAKPKSRVSGYPVRPKPGQLWTFKLPGKKRMTKTVAYVSREWLGLSAKGKHIRKHVVNFYHQPRGRETRVRIRVLWRYGKMLREG
jgi:hypothetical protein